MKPTISLDFDGVLNSYESGWIEPDFIPDAPVPGTFTFIHTLLEDFNPVIYSSRSNYTNGIRAMRVWCKFWMKKELPKDKCARLSDWLDREETFPKEKPPALLTIDDRAITFTGVWPTIEEIKAFRPWNKR